MIDYVNEGMTPMQALMSGTVNAADAAGVDVGRLEPGKAADIVALSRNPLEDIKAVMDVGFVMRDGIVFKGPGAVE
jgi:imidazolonepropionase-like amidohydrolase